MGQLWQLPHKVFIIRWASTQLTNEYQTFRLLVPNSCDGFVLQNSVNFRALCLLPPSWVSASRLHLKLCPRTPYRRAFNVRNALITKQFFLGLFGKRCAYFYPKVDWKVAQLHQGHDLKHQRVWPTHILYNATMAAQFSGMAHCLHAVGNTLSQNNVVSFWNFMHASIAIC
jgi:hypothetical protein